MLETLHSGQVNDLEAEVPLGMPGSPSQQRFLLMSTLLAAGTWVPASHVGALHGAPGVASAWASTVRAGTGNEKQMKAFLFSLSKTKTYILREAHIP